MENFRNVFDKLSRRPSNVLSSLESALKDSSDSNAIFPLKKVDLTGRLRVEGLRAHGGSADVYAGRLKVKGSKAESMTVAVKVFRLHVQDDGTDKMHSFVRELKIWTVLKHRNVLPCLGFAEYNNSPALVSEWMENGNLIEFLSMNVNADRLEMARGIVYGLEYLHKNGIVHSDLKGANILVGPEGESMLSDFGISRLVKDGVTITGTSDFKFSVNWLAIELVVPSDTEGSVPSNRLHTMKSDVWALGMVFYEMLTLKKPFYGSNEFLIPCLIANGKLPKKPTKEECPSDNLDDVWDGCMRCWEKDPERRPTATEIARELRIRVKLLKIQEFKVHSSWINCVAFSPVDTKTLATGSEDNVVCIWALSKDGKSGRRLHRLAGHTGDVTSIAWSSDGSFLVSGSGDQTFRKWNASTGECKFTVRTPDLLYAVAISPDNKGIVSCGGSCVDVWNALTGSRILGPLKGHTGNVLTVTYTPDGRRILSGSADNSVIVRDSTTGEILFGPLTVHSDAIRSISFRPSGKTFVTGSSDKTITIWNTNTFQPVHKNLRAHGDWVISVQYSPDGRFIVSASVDGTMRVWDARKGRVVSKLAENGCGVWTIGFSRGGWVASGGVDGTVRIWQLRELDGF